MTARILTVTFLASVVAMASPITLTLQNGLLSGAAGATLTFVGTTTNTTGVTQNLNSDSFTLQSPLVLNDTLYFANWPLSLSGSQTFGPQGLFTVFIPSATPLGLYNGTFNILGGPGDSDQLLLGTAAFQVNVGSATVPEPATGLLLLGSAALVLLKLWVSGTLWSNGGEESPSENGL